MSQFKLSVPGIEVSGATILAFTSEMEVFRRRAIIILEKHGIKNVQPDNWYPAQNYLDAFKEIFEKLGDTIIRYIGKQIPESAKWPPEIKTIEDALASIDVAYHLNHRKNGKVMFDPETGEMIEGIGHYKFEKIDDNSAKIICDNPYPCDFDMGIIEATASKFKPKGKLIKVIHEEGSCRKKGDASCTYLVRW